jgi:hypothetical protein
MKIRNKIIGLMISLVAMPTFAFAQKDKTYIGAEYTNNSINSGISNVSSNLDEKDNGYAIFIGSEVNKKLDVEIIYNDFGKASISGVNGSQFRYEGTLYTFNQTESMSQEGTSWGFAFRPKAEITKNLDVVGILGAHKWKVKTNINGTTTNISESETGWDFLYGLGVKANYDQFSVGLNYRIYKVDSDEIKSWGLRAAYAF